MRKTKVASVVAWMVLASALMVVGCGTPTGTSPQGPGPSTSPTVALGAPTGTLTAGIAGTATFAATTANLADGTAGAFTWYTSAAGTTSTTAPTGVTPTVTAVAGNAATVTMTATTSTVAGTYYFTLTEGAAVSAVKSLAIVAPGGAATVSLGAASTVLTVATAGTVTYAATLTNVADGTAGTFTWYTSAAGTSTASAPQGITPSVTAVAGNTATVTMTATSATLVGVSYFTLTEGGAVSAVMALNVASVTVYSQSAAVVTGTGGSATFAVVTSRIADGTTGTFTWYTSSGGVTTTPTPAGITASVTPVTSSAASVTLTADASVPAGTYYFRLFEGPVRSVVKSFVVSPVPSVTVNSQSGALTAGIAGSATYYTTVANLASATVGTFSWWASDGTTPASTPPGVTASIPSLSGSTWGYVTMTATSSTVAGTYYFRLNEGGGLSSLKTLTISPAPTVTVGAASGTLIYGYSQAMHYALTTTQVPSPTSGTVTWYTDATGTTATTTPTGMTAGAGNVAADGSAQLTATSSASTPIGTYYLRVKYLSAVSEVMAIPVVLGTVNLNAAGQTGKVYVYWSGIVGATSYNVYRSETAGLQGALLTTATAASPAYYDNALVIGTTYYYQVTALKDAVEMTTSNQVSAAATN